MTVLEQIRGLVRNVDPAHAPLTDADILIAQQLIESEVRARLHRLYPHGLPDPLPDPVNAIVVYLTAALLEARTLSLTHVVSSQNPYAVQLYQKGMELLTEVQAGRLFVPGQDARWALPLFQPPSTPSPFVPVQQYRRSGSHG